MYETLHCIGDFCKMLCLKSEFHAKKSKISNFLGKNTPKVIIFAPKVAEKSVKHSVPLGSSSSYSPLIFTKIYFEKTFDFYCRNEELLLDSSLFSQKKYFITLTLSLMVNRIDFVERKYQGAGNSLV